MITNTELENKGNLSPSQIVSYKKDVDKLYFQTANDVVLEITVVRDSVLRFRYSTTGVFENDFSYGVTIHASRGYNQLKVEETEETYSINSCLKQFLFVSEVITVVPEKRGEDLIISEKQLRYAIGNKKREAVVIRTLPNTKDKLSRQYANTNPPFLSEAAAIYLRNKGVKHLLIDLPSVDKEKDNGELLAHKAFWDVHGAIRKEATITELIYVTNAVKDGKYILNLLVAPFQNDASPSKPVLYKLFD